MPSYETMRQATVDALKLAASEAFQRHGKTSIFGFAICTDNDVGSVFHTYTTRDWVIEREPGYPEIGFIPVEWEYGYDSNPFNALSGSFFQLSRSDLYLPDAEQEKSRITRFRILVEAMKICRNEGLFDSSTLLSVGSTDPDDELEKLTCHAARYLNDKAIADAYCRVFFPIGTLPASRKPTDGQ